MHKIEALLVCSLLLSASTASATTRTWPGAVPCNGMLQACINASAANDTVLVATSSPIAESVTINKSFVLRAAPGYRPVFSAGNTISGALSGAGAATWHVEGFTLQSGFVAVNVSNGTQVDVVIRRMHVEADLSGAAEISVYKSGAATTTLSYDLSENVLSYFWDTFDGALRAALQVLDGGTGTTSGRIRENRVTATGSSSIGILVSTADRTHRTEVIGNEVLGGRSGSIFVRQGSLISATGGTLTALLFNNVVRSATAGTRTAYGIKVDVYDGSANVRAWHNTVVDAFYGVNLYVDPSATSIGGSIRANVFAYLLTSGIQRAGSVGPVTDSDNLFFETAETPATPGLSPTSVFADPRLRRVPEDPHLLPGSPAIDRLAATTLTTVLAAENLPLTDGDGLRRVKRANTAAVTATALDLGALESGDVTFLHEIPELPEAFSLLDDGALNAIPDAYPIATANWNPDGGSGIYNDHPVSLSYFAGTRWGIRQEDLANFSAGARFNIFAPGAGDGRYLHANTVGNTGPSATTLDAVGLNGQSDRIVLAMRNPGTGVVTDLPSPIAVGYAASAWRVSRLDAGAMPTNGGFDIYFQEPSINAFRHQTSAGNVGANVTILDHPLLDGHPYARFHITPSTNGGTVNDHETGVYYESGFGRWAIFNQDLATMPAGVEFHVLVDPSAVPEPGAGAASVASLAALCALARRRKRLRSLR